MMLQAQGKTKAQLNENLRSHLIGVFDMIGRRFVRYRTTRLVKVNFVKLAQTATPKPSQQPYPPQNLVGLKVLQKCNRLFK
jgi:hypothetical protein